VTLIVIEDPGGRGDVVDQEVAVVETVQESVVTRSLVKDINIHLVAPEASLLMLLDLADLAQEVVPKIEVKGVSLVVSLDLVVEQDLDQDQRIEAESTKNLREGIEEEVQVLVLGVVAGIQNLAQLEIVKTETEIEKAMIEIAAIEGVETGRVEKEEVKRGLAVNVKNEVKMEVKFAREKGSYHQLKKMRLTKLL